MKKFNTLFIALLSLMLCLLVSCNGDQPNSYKPITMHEGCYLGQDSARIVVFPRDQHPASDASFAAMLVQKDEYGTYQASVPFRLSDFSDSLGSATVHIGDAEQILLTDGASYVALINGQDTLRFVLQPSAPQAPRNVRGTWVLKIAINEYMSYNLLDVAIADDMSGVVHLNIDEQMIQMMLMMSGMMPEDMPSDDSWLDLLQDVPTTFPGEVWYSMDAGMGVFLPAQPVPEMPVLFTTPSESVIRITVAGYNLDLKR